MLNLKLPGKKQFISQLVEHIEGFCQKLVLFKASLQKNDISHFPSCCELIGEGTRIDFCAFSTKIGKVTNEFNRRFADFDLLKTKLEFLSNPMEVDIESQASCFQLELCELQADLFLFSKKNERYVFWKLVSKEQFPCLRDFALKMCSCLVARIFVKAFFLV